MSYHISYEPHLKGKYPPLKKRMVSGKWIFTIALLIGIILLSTVPNASSRIRDLILPGDPQKTEAALSDFASDLQEGEGIKEAFTSFCLEILNEVQ